MSIFYSTGDQLELIYGTKAKNQTLIAEGDYDFYFMYGDAYQFYDNARGGNDTIVGKSSGLMASISIENELYGDAQYMEFSAGGNDHITGGDGVTVNSLFGDAYFMRSSKGGNDYLAGGSNAATNVLFGDAYFLIGSTDQAGQIYGSQGGNDILIASESGEIRLYGDAETLFNSSGGNDLIIGAGSGSVKMVGDGEEGDAASGGNDRLVSGESDDQMWGDFCRVTTSRYTLGHDTFVFKSNNGNDTIGDFKSGDDKIELSGISGIDDFSDLQITESDGDSVIAFSADDSITLIGALGLQAQDFIFS